MILELGATRLRLRLGTRTVSVAGETAPEGPDGPDFVVHLDSIEEWEPPHAHETLSLDDIGRITRAIEAAFDARRLSVAFE